MSYFKPLTSLIRYLENSKLPLANYLITFFCIILLRNYFEFFSHSFFFALLGYESHTLLITLCHITLFYIFIATTLASCIHILTKEAIPKILRVILPAFIVTLIVPILDLLVSRGAGHHIYYLFPAPATTRGIFYYYSHFFGDYTGISLGMRVEIALATIGSFFYFRTKTKFLRSILGALTVYSVIFITIASPCFIQHFFKSANLGYNANLDQIMFYFFLIALFPSSILLAYFANKKIFLAITKDLRWMRLGHFSLMLIFGILIATSKPETIVVIKAILIIIAILFFWLFSVITNNVADQKIDSICNPNRPLIQKTVAIDTYLQIGYCALFLSMLYSLVVGVHTFLIMTWSILAYYLYSMPPLRLKRIPILSKILIAGVSFGFVLLGFHVTHGNWHLFPKNLLLLFLIGFTICINFIDIKDYRGDKAQHILTLPVLVGEKNAKFIIGMAFICGYVSLYWIFKIPNLLPWLLAVGGIEFYFINQENYHEWKVFGIYLLSAIALLTYIICTTT